MTNLTCLFFFLEGGEEYPNLVSKIQGQGHVRGEKVFFMSVSNIMRSEAITCLQTNYLT